jgi:uncharacterized protein involved in exopolysaccharide biosynthesis
VTATRDPGVERIHPLPVIEPASAEESGEVARPARIKLAVEYIRERKTLAIMAMVVAAILGTSVALLLPAKYTARASFYSEGKQGGDLSSLSSSLGPLSALLSVAGGSLGSTSPAFFVDLLKSQTFFDSLGASPIPIGPNGPTVLVKNYVIKSAKNDSIRRWKSRIKLKKMIEVSTQPSGVVVVRVDAKSPVAAAAIANRSVDLIDNLNVRFRRDQAAARRKFTEGFLADVEARLDASEDRLQTFLMNNRSLLTLRGDQSPVLKRQEERLRAETLRLTSLKEQLESTIENARLTEYNDAPMVARVDRAAVPEKRSGPPRTLIALGSILLAATLLFFFAYLRAPRSEKW